MKVYNTLSGRKEEFVPLTDTVRMYVCGVTPYDDCHLGHAMSYILFDAMRRYLEFRGYKVKYVQNFTDIDDKIINRAQKLGKSPQELANYYIERYFSDMDALNIRRADVYPKATEEIPAMHQVIARLIEKGHAYQAQDGVYFRVKSFPTYGALSRRSLEDMKSEEETGKEHPMDFALWKSSKPGEPFWESPWGKGRPGWHIECTAMSMKYLGETLDIHGGGQDLVFPHHENEIAQSESFTGKPFVKYWLHNGMLVLGEEKMSKSLGNLVTVREILQKVTADGLRIFVLSSHYRSPLTYTEEALAAAQKGTERLTEAARAESESSVEAQIDLESYRRRFTEAADDDFSFAQGIAALFDLARDINKGREAGLNVETAQKALLEMGGVLGLKLETEIEIEIEESVEAAPFIELLLSIRKELRSQKQFALADKIRSGLAEQGITIEDTPKGARWKYERKTTQTSERSTK